MLQIQNQKTLNINKGFTVVELMVVVFILLVAFVGILGLLAFSLQTSNLIKETTYANFLAQEAIEAVRNFRDGTDWSTGGLGDLTAGVYHTEKTGDIPPKWSLLSGEETINNFTREIILEDVNRDAVTHDIVETGGVNDSDTEKVQVIVSWKDKTVEITTYFTNWQ